MRLSRKLYAALLLQSVAALGMFVVAVLFIAMLFGMVSNVQDEIEAVLQAETALDDSTALSIRAITEEAMDDSIGILVIGLLLLFVFGVGGTVVGLIIGLVVISGTTEKLNTMNQDIGQFSRLYGNMLSSETPVSQQDLAAKGDFLVRICRDFRYLVAGKNGGDY